MIEVEHLTKRYASHTAVRDLSFSIAQGEIVGFLGPNGAGKSTTMRMVTGFLAPTEGRIKIGTVDALEDPIGARRQIGYMPEACPLYLEMRVREYLRYRAELKGVPRRQVKERVEVSVEQAAIAEVADRIIGQLSKGYRQRVGLADALVADPPLLILDEPTAGLDPNQIRQVRDLVRRLAENKTVLISTHILPEVEAICDRVLILHRGKLVRDGATSTLRSDIGGREDIRLTGRGAPEAFEAALGAVEGATLVETRALSGEGDDAVVRCRLEGDAETRTIEAIFRAVVEAGLVLHELVRKQASLEDVFAELTTDEPAAPPPDEGDDPDEGDEDPDDDDDAADEDPDDDDDAANEDPDDDDDAADEDPDDDDDAADDEGSDERSGR